MAEQELLCDCLSRLNLSGVSYMLVGSMASNYWGVPRSTHDIDFVIEYAAKDVTRITKTFEDDFFIQESSESFLAHRQPIQIASDAIATSINQTNAV